MLFQPVRLTRASDGIVRQIKDSIFGGRLGPGDALPSEKELGEQFKVSRVTVRDALRVLESQGLVAIKVGARGGAFVARPGPGPVSESLTNMLRLKQATLHDLVEARILVEPHVAAMAARRATPDDVRAMEDAIAAAREARAAGDRYFIPTSVAFHLALAEAARNPVLLFTVSSFRALFHEALEALLPADDMAKRAIADHQRILEAIKTRDADRARRVMHEHLSYFAARVGASGDARASRGPTSGPQPRNQSGLVPEGGGPARRPGRVRRPLHAARRRPGTDRRP